MRDVAARAGMSLRTVSYVVSGTKPVAAATRARVEQAVDELGYRPNVLARGLRQGRSGILALVLPELDVPYFAELVRAVTGVTREVGYTLMVDQTDGDLAREQDVVLNLSRARLFDGILFSALALSADSLRDRDPGTAMVLLGEHLSDGTFDHVGIDNVTAAREATGHLLDLGRTRVAAIGDQPYVTGETAQLRTLGYRQAHLQRGLQVHEDLIVPTRAFHRADGAHVMEDLLHRHPRPDAVFCYNDLLALGAIRTLLASGVRVPEDIAVAGFDDIEDGRYCTPTLTTVSPDKAAIAQTAVELLINQIDGTSPHRGRDVTVHHQLLIRESTTGTQPPA